MSLQPGNYEEGTIVASDTGAAVMTLLPDGNLVIFVGEDPVWSSGTQNPDNSDPYYLFLSALGQLSVTCGNATLWKSPTPTFTAGAVSLQLTDSGIAQIYTGDSIMWQTTASQGTEAILQVVDADGQVGFEADYAYAPLAQASLQMPAAANASASASGSAAAAAPAQTPKGAWVLRSQRWPNPAWQPKTQEPPAGGDAPDPVSSGLAVAQFAAKFIKDNEPVTNIPSITTSVLSPLDTNSLDYPNAIAEDSESITIRFTVVPTNLTQFQVKVCLSGAYHAGAPEGRGIPPGYYLPSLYVNVQTCHIYWPYSCTAKATVANPINVGSATDVDVQLDIGTSFLFTSLIQDIQANIVFRAQGSSGFTIYSASV